MTRKRILLLFQILLPLAAAAVFGIWPRAYALQSALIGEQTARADLFPAQVAAYQRRILQFQPWRMEIWEQIGRIELQQEHWPAAADAFEKAKAAQQLSPDGELLLGQAYQAADEPQAALAAYQSAAQRGLPQGSLDAAALLRAEGRLPEAALILEDYLSIFPNDSDVLLQLGKYYSSADPGRALIFLRRIPPDAVQYRAAQSLAEVIPQAAREPDAAYASLLLGRALGSQGDWDLALTLFESAVQSAPQYAEAWAFLAQAQQELGQDGFPALQQALQLDPHSTSAQSLLALYYRRQNRPELALAYLNALAVQQPQEAVWQLEMGNVLTEMGNLISAFRHFQQAVELAPDSTASWRALAEFCIIHSYEPRTQGLPAARQVLLLAPQDPASSDLMGWVLLNLGDSTNAERFLHQSLTRDAQYAPAHLHLGQLYLQSGSLVSAREHFLLAAKLTDPGDPLHTLAQRLLK